MICKGTMERYALLFLFLQISVSVSELCPDGFELLGDRCYLFVENALEWQAARDFCRRLSSSRSVDLAVFDLTPEDWYRVFRRSGQLGSQDYYWVGGSDHLHKGLWSWIDGRPLDAEKSYWRDEDPHELTNTSCLEIYRNSKEVFPRWKFALVPCVGYERGFICQYELERLS
ncbi:type-2 ice-structuring protein-like [Macrobrachium rosenbergii]|uniref:type-2 ice-structuring protein-like n=1 Tax=Macrobrachium rosenbergii TaxID=79674 RepID=UPI0034D66AF7